MAKAKGSAKTGGRNKGTLNKTTQKRKEIAVQALSEGITPLEVMLGAMRGLWERALEMKDAVERAKLEAEASSIAKDAAPYVHPRLTSVEHSGDLTHTHEHAEPAQAAAEATDIFHSPAGKPNGGDKVVH